MPHGVGYVCHGIVLVVVEHAVVVLGLVVLALKNVVTIPVEGLGNGVVGGNLDVLPVGAIGQQAGDGHVKAREGGCLYVQAAAACGDLVAVVAQSLGIAVDEINGVLVARGGAVVRGVHLQLHARGALDDLSEGVGGHLTRVGIEFDHVLRRAVCHQLEGEVGRLGLGLGLGFGFGFGGGFGGHVSHRGVADGGVIGPAFLVAGGQRGRHHETGEKGAEDASRLRGKVFHRVPPLGRWGPPEVLCIVYSICRVLSRLFG